MKQTYVIQFETAKRADFWMRETYQKFKSDILDVNYRRKTIEFEEAIYFFISYIDQPRLFRGVEYKFMSAEDLYIILDDPERKRLETYEGD